MRMGRIARSGLAMALAAAALGVASASLAADYTLNAIVSLTGPAAFLGKGEQQALTLAEKVVNDTGGIKGEKLAIRRSTMTRPIPRLPCSSPTTSSRRSRR